MAVIDIESLRKRIIAQADAQGDHGWLSIEVPVEISDQGRLRVPRGAFENWAVARSNGSHLATPWKPVSPIGVKQGADDPYHTDWMLGAGLDPLDMKADGKNSFHEELSEAAYRARGDIESRLLGFKASILLQGPFVHGRVHIPQSYDDLPEGCDEDGLPPVSIVKNAGPDWLAVAFATLRLGGAVIVERGGEMAHLVTELRESSQGPILRIEKARSIYPDGSVVRIDPAAGSVALCEDERLYRAAAANALVAEPIFIAEQPKSPATAMSPAPAPSSPAEQAPKHRFSLTRIDKSQKDPTRNYGYLEPIRKLEGIRYNIYATLHHNGDIHRTVERKSGRTGLLELIASPRDPALPKMSFVVVADDFSNLDMADACSIALDLADPQQKIDVENYRLAERARVLKERDDAKAKWSSMSESDLLEFARKLGSDENDLYLEFTSEEINPSEYYPHSRQYADAFDIIDEIVREKSYEWDTDDIRPKVKALQALAEAERIRRRELEAFMKATPPLKAR